MPHVVVTPEAISLDGRPAIILAGSLHYFRLPHPDLWPAVLERIRMGGLNTVLVPIPWAYHSPEAGFHDFTGPRDLARLIDDVERAGLWLIPHLGPWIGAGLDAGGVPSWALGLPEARLFLAQGTPFAPPSPLLRQVAVWWERALALLSARPNLIAIAIDPGPGTAPEVTSEAMNSLLALLRQRGVSVPIAVPRTDQLEWEAGLLEFGTTGFGALAASARSERRGLRLAVLDLSSVPIPPSRSAASGSRRPDPAYVPSWMALSLGGGVRLVVLDPVHTGVSWGRWTPAIGLGASGAGAPIAEGTALSDAYYRMRRMALTIETVGTVLAAGGPPLGLDVDPVEHLAGGQTGPAGTVAFLRGREAAESIAEVTLSRAAAPISLGDVQVPRKSVVVLPLDWQLVDGRLLSTSMEPILHTVVAGRELLILQNAAGGEVLLPSRFRVRHRRGPVYVERTREGVLVHFDPDRLVSVVLDGDQGPLQLLGLEPDLAERTWPLDDLWRTTPVYPAAWDAGDDQPARGVVIGADFAAPEVGGGFRIEYSKKGFGYRWGPWRGGDPHTWLAPLSWPMAVPLVVPALTWTSRAGAPEVQPDYDARTWLEASSERGLAPELYGIACGFAWYRGYFSGQAAEVRIVCRGACDLYLNGTHIASLNPALEPAPLAPRTIPLPARHLRAENVLAVLVESQGLAQHLRLSSESQGLSSCELEGSRFDHWVVKGGLTGEVRVQGFWGFADWDLVDGCGASDVVWHRAVFDLLNPVDREAPVFLFLDQTPSTCILYLNGHLVGRSRYPQGLQRRFWLPGGLLRLRGRNELLIAQWTRGANPGIGVAQLEAGAVWSWRTEGGGT